MYKQHVLPISAVIPKGKNETSVPLHPLEGSNLLSAVSQSHLYLAHAALSNYEGKPGPVAIQIKKEEPEDEEFQDASETGGEEQTYELGISLAFKTKLNPDGTPSNLGESSLLTFQKEDQAYFIAADAVRRINQVMLTNHAIFSKAPLFIDWWDSEWQSDIFDNEEMELLAEKGGYGVLTPEKYASDRLPSHVNPYQMPPIDCPRSRFIHLRLHISAGLRAHFSTLIHLEHLGFEVARFRANAVSSQSDRNWTITSATKRPQASISKVALRIDIEKEPSFAEIKKKYTFTVPATAQYSNKNLAYWLDNQLSHIEEATNINVGITGTDADDADAAFKFLYFNDTRAVLTYHISSSLATRLKAPSLIIESSTVLGKADIDTEEQLAANVLTAQMVGLIYIVSPHGRDEYWPGKLFGMLEPKADGSFSLIQVPFNTAPLTLDGNLLAQIPNGQLKLHFYVHNPSDGNFYPLAWQENLKLQGCIVYRQKINA